MYDTLALVIGISVMAIFGIGVLILVWRLD
jgi:hypothetical protein